MMLKLMRTRSQSSLQMLVASLLIVLPSLTTAAEELVWKFATGDVHHYQMIQEMGMSMDIGPSGTTKTSLKQTMDMTWKIEAVDENGNAMVTQQITRVQMEISAPGQDKILYDTDSDETPQGYAAMLAPMLTALTKGTFSQTMAPNGEISNVMVPEDLVEAMSRGPGAAMMGSLATEEGLKNMAKQGAMTLPKAEDLAEGHEWSTSMEMTNPAVGNITIDTTYKYAGSREVEGQQFEVFVPTIVTKYSEGQAATIKSVKQETNGEILFNRTAGRLESSTINQHMVNAVTAVGNEFNQTIDQKVTFKIVEPTDATQ